MWLIHETKFRSVLEAWDNVGWWEVEESWSCFILLREDARSQQRYQFPERWETKRIWVQSRVEKQNLEGHRWLQSKRGRLQEQNGSVQQKNLRRVRPATNRNQKWRSRPDNKIMRKRKNPLRDCRQKSRKAEWGNPRIHKKVWRGERRNKQFGEEVWELQNGDWE